MESDSTLFDEAAAEVAAVTGWSCERTVCHRANPREGGFDGVASIRVNGKTLSRPYVIRRWPNPATVHFLTSLKREGSGGVLLVSAHVGDRLAGILRAEGIDFMDAAGNASISAPGVCISILGRKARQKQIAGQRARAFHPSGLRLIFALMTDSGLSEDRPGTALVSRPYRDIGAATGMAHSTVGWIMADLIRLGYVVEMEAGVRGLVERGRLLERWVQGYDETLRHGLVLERYRPVRADWWRNVILEGGLWSGEVAAALLDKSLKPGTFTIFGDRPSNAFVVAHGLQKDVNGVVEFLSPFWPASFDPSGPCVHPILIYADLMAVDDDRTREAARIMYDHYLRTLIETS